MLIQEHVDHIEKKQTLKQHLVELFTALCDLKLTPQAQVGPGLFCTGIPTPCLNVAIGAAEKPSAFFNGAPFTWYVDEGQQGEEVCGSGFQDLGVYRGVIGALDPARFQCSLPAGAACEPIASIEALQEFMEIIGPIFHITGLAAELYKQSLWKLYEQGKMQHWLIRIDGIAVSAVSTFISREIVSFWNGATLPQLRRQGISTAIRSIALKNAVDSGCRVGISYLMADALAYGICKKLGYETHWHYRALLQGTENFHTGLRV